MGDPFPVWFKNFPGHSTCRTDISKLICFDYKSARAATYEFLHFSNVWLLCKFKNLIAQNQYRFYLLKIVIWYIFLIVMPWYLVCRIYKRTIRYSNFRVSEGQWIHLISVITFLDFICFSLLLSNWTGRPDENNYQTFANSIFRNTTLFMC